MAQRNPIDGHPPGNHPGESSLSKASVAIDTLSVTLPPPNMSAEDYVDHIRRALFPGGPAEIKVGNGNFGFHQGLHLLAPVAGRKTLISSVYVGEKAQSDRWLLLIPGQGCLLIQAWQAVHSLLNTAGAKVTRIDLCQDYIEGEFTVDDAVAAYLAGQFNVRGRRPSCRQHGDWLVKKEGRTLYVGRADNGKQARIYEKGKQLGQLNSPWVRAEVQFTAKGKDIPLDVLLNPAGHFAGAYPAFARLSVAAAQVIPARKKARVAELSKKLHHLRKTYGVTVSQALMTDGCTPENLLDQLALPICADLGKSETKSISWEEVKNELTNY